MPRKRAIPRCPIYIISSKRDSTQTPRAQMSKKGFRPRKSRRFLISICNRHPQSKKGGNFFPEKSPGKKFPENFRGPRPGPGPGHFPARQFFPQRDVPGPGHGRPQNVPFFGKISNFRNSAHFCLVIQGRKSLYFRKSHFLRSGVAVLPPWHIC